MSGRKVFARREIRVGLKFVGLAAVATAIYFVTSGALLGLAFCVLLAAHRLCGVSYGTALSPLRALAPILAVIALALALFDGVPAAIVVLARLSVLVLAAHLVTETTTTGEMIDAFVCGLRPLRLFGVEPERVGMALALTLRFVPVLHAVVSDVMEAQKARGHHRDMRALAVPVIVRTLKMADDVSEALEARGFGSQRR
jgi:biotin transport system permease protein